MTGTLILENLHIEYPEVLLFDRLNLQFPAGSLIGIETDVLDGATSLLKGIGGMLSDIDGRSILNGHDILTMPASERARKVGFVYEDEGLISLYDVFQNIALPLEFHTDLTFAQTQSLIDATIEALNVPSTLVWMQPHELNDVQTRLVNLARALVMSPELLLIDELEGGMPDDMIDSTMQLLKGKARKDNMTVLLTSSNEHVLREVDQVLKIKSNQLVESSV
ncbi:MAG: ATP-binding cassette domain-containing protein [Gammaproteobacteria bacterium]|jgi:ABC-type lipoprotein export system ATPase subunit|nr:ATP-binding cassette domain-containing protein [Gammaproteobacteria bacterium]MBT5054260.1 ATP-binding cassette domain-containing protein [Gammaproteobacteria bacterium]MDC0465083.1 ATP-binding cassette domain-containing protein [Pseudomonadales bacterium]